MKADGPPLHILRAFFSENREAFSHASERYEHGVILGLEAGRIRFGWGEEGEWTECGPGELLLVPPETTLRREALERIGFYFVEFTWPEEAEAWLPGGLILPRDTARYRSTVRLIRTLSHAAMFHREAALRRRDGVLSDLLDQLRYEAATQDGPQTPMSSPPDRLMWQIARELEEHPGEGERLEAVAARWRLTPSDLSRRFRAAFGVSPSVYRIRLRLEAACTLLRDTHLTLEEIAGRCGFANAFYLSRLFSREIGIAPSVYRRKHQV